MKQFTIYYYQWSSLLSIIINEIVYYLLLSMKQFPIYYFQWNSFLFIIINEAVYYLLLSSIKQFIIY